MLRLLECFSASEITATEVNGLKVTNRKKKKNHYTKNEVIRNSDSQVAFHISKQHLRILI